MTDSQLSDAGERLATRLATGGQQSDSAIVRLLLLRWEQEELARHVQPHSEDASEGCEGWRADMRANWQRTVYKGVGPRGESG